MRAAQWIVAAGMGIAALWGGCTVEVPSNNASSSGEATSTSSSSSSSSTGKPQDCTIGSTGVLAGECGACIDVSCVDEQTACNPDDFTCPATGCADCLTGDQAACNADNNPFVQAMFGCAQTNCNLECFPPPPDWTCNPATSAPSGEGMCVTLDAKITCNPVTGAPCKLDAGESCDINGDGYKCWPAPNDVKICGECDGSAGPFCAAGLTCNGGKCARYCCDDSECGEGATCDKATMYPGGLGQCLGQATMGSSSSSSGMGGMGGAGGMGGSSSSSSGMGGMGGAGGMGNSSSSSSGSTSSSSSSSSSTSSSSSSSSSGMMMDGGVIDGG